MALLPKILNTFISIFNKARKIAIENRYSSVVNCVSGTNLLLDAI